VTLLKKIFPYLISESTPLSGREKLRSTLAAFLAILLVGVVSSHYLHGSGLQIMITSMGASAVLLFAAPNSPLTQPWPLVGGHLISAFVGVTCAWLVPEQWLAAALAVSLSVLAMHLTRSLHPPGGAVALLPVLGSDHFLIDGYYFLVAPVGLNVLLMLGMALLLNNLLPGHRYPARPFPRKDKQHRHADPTPLERLGIKKEDLHNALQGLDVFLDVSEADLNLVYNRAGMAAAQRKMGELTCGEIMSRDLVTVEYGTELEEAWAQLRFHRVKVLPVIDRARRVIGIVSLVDFLKRADLKTYETFQDKLIKFIRRTPGDYSEKPEVVGQIMASPVHTVREDAHILELVPLLADRGLHHVPVVNQENRLVGMITQSDLIAALYHSGVSQPVAVK
jgi:CBS domain-containing membrane protein